MMQTISSLYRVPNVKYDVLVVYTNHPYAGAMRGYGNPQATFALESQVDQLAEESGMDPLEIRLKNAQESGETTPPGHVPANLRIEGMPGNRRKECLEEDSPAAPSRCRDMIRTASCTSRI
jgi:CO/xanthine dehydrogenase Mo-binding subunit